VQATVRRFDPTTREGSVLLDDGIELAFTAEAFDAGPLLTVRFGQRVRITVAGGAGKRVVTSLTLATFPSE